MKVAITVISGWVIIFGLGFWAGRETASSGASKPISFASITDGKASEDCIAIPHQDGYTDLLCCGGKIIPRKVSRSAITHGPNSPVISGSGNTVVSYGDEGCIERAIEGGRAQCGGAPPK